MILLSYKPNLKNNPKYQQNNFTKLYIKIMFLFIVFRYKHNDNDKRIKYHALHVNANIGTRLDNWKWNTLRHTSLYLPMFILLYFAWNDNAADREIWTLNFLQFTQCTAWIVVFPQIPQDDRQATAEYIMNAWSMQ